MKGNSSVNLNLISPASAAVDLAVSIGRGLDHAARPFFVAGILPATELDPLFLEKVAARLAVTSTPPEAGYVDPWFNAIVRDDVATAESIERALDAAGLHDVFMRAFAAINKFAVGLCDLLDLPALDPDTIIGGDLPGPRADTITSADLPQLRTSMQGYIADDVFSDEFHGICRTVIDAIDQARDDDQDTHAALANSLERFTAAGEAEAKRCARLVELCNRIAEAESGEQVRVVLADLLALLPAAPGARLAAGILDALADSLTTLALVEIPAASKRLH